jgi:hypothetical protein
MRVSGKTAESGKHYGGRGVPPILCHQQGRIYKKNCSRTLRRQGLLPWPEGMYARACVGLVFFSFFFFCGKTVWDFAGWQEDMDSWTVASDNKAKAQVSICC